eukprot:1152083-Pelagomonas_calceolata.AAC.1
MKEEGPATRKSKLEARKTGVPDLQQQINECAKEHGNAQLPWVWDVLIKYVLCAVLPALLLSSTYSDAIGNSRGYQDYPAWLQSAAQHHELLSTMAPYPGSILAV